MKRFLGYAGAALGTALIVLVVLVCLPLTAPRLAGYEAYAIVSGSMEPSIPTGSLVYAKAAQPQTVQPGDVIVFYGGAAGDTVITHRVTENDAQRRQFITKGDANAAEDVSPIPYAHLLGRVERSVPVLGYFLPAVTTLEGKLSLLGVLAAALLLRAAGGRLLRSAPADGE